MKECSKSIQRRFSDSNFFRKYFSGTGIDIGGKPDPLSLYKEFFPLVENIRTWDLEDGDAQFMQSVDDESFNFVHSSHCLEHLNDPIEGLKNWFRIIRQNGYLIITLPDEDLYEQGVFPSTFNYDHKHTFTINKTNSWCNKSINIIELLTHLGCYAEIIKIELLHGSYRFNIPRFDQTITPVGECGIEVIIRKRTEQEIKLGGRIIKPETIKDKELRKHYNQYSDDMNNIKIFNKTTLPFKNDSEVGVPSR